MKKMMMKCMRKMKHMMMIETKQKGLKHTTMIEI